jgi:transformation/transcription domain-associated protein
MKSYEHRLASSVLNLFQICPRDAISTRKDLLTALKHIISTNFRKIFFAHITTLLDEKVLLGKFRPGEHTQLRTMAYNALAELLHHARAKLTMAQISKVVHTYSRVLHDTSIKMPLVVQMNSLRLLLNMVEPVYHNKEEVASKGRDILYRILETFTMKLQTLVDYGIERVEGIEQDRLHGKNKSDSVSTSEELNISNDQQKETKRRREQMYYYMSSDSPDTIHHVLDLTKQIISGHRNLIWCINNYGAQREKNTGSKEKNADKSKSSKQQKPSSWHEEIALQTLNVSERALLDKYIFWTIKALQVYRSEYVNDTKNSVSTQQGTQQASSKPHHEALESFAASLAVLDSYNFHRIVGPRMELLVTTMIQDEETFVIATSLLQSSNVTSEFTSCLLDFLINRMDYLDTSCTDHTDKKKQGSVTLQLFEAIFNSISKFTKNEAVLRPRLQLLIASCLRRATANDVDTWPSNYIQLLRSLFRSIAGGKFEESYKEILPLLPTLLNGLYRIYSVTFDDTLRNSIIELCLTVPARLSSLLPHLSLLIRVIVPALQTDSKDLNNLG